MTHDCSPACTAGWSPSGKCHCTLCGVNFTTVGNFDRHRRTVNGKRVCVDVASSEAFAELRPGVWGQPGESVPAFMRSRAA